MIYLLLMLVGLGVGFTAGVLAIGGGVLLFPTLTELLGFDEKPAGAMTLAVLALPVALPGAWSLYQRGHIEPKHFIYVGFIAVAFACGTFLGGQSRGLLSLKQIAALRIAFGFLLIFVAGRMIFRSDSNVRNAVLGLAVTIPAWLAYLGLRTLGRRYSKPPSLGETIEKASINEPEQDPPIEYYI